MSRAAGATGQVASRSLKCPMPALQQQPQRYLATSTSRPGIPTTMRAAVVEKFGAPLVIKNVPVPTPGKDEVLIKVRHITCRLVSCRVVLC